MGRAIDMENDIHKLKIQVETIENALEKVIQTVDKLEAKSPSVEHIDLVEDVPANEELEEALQDVSDEEEEDDSEEAAPKKNANNKKNKK